MGTVGTIRLKSIWKMLKKCAPGYSKKEADHYWHIEFGELHAQLPTGAHGKRTGQAEIQLGQVKGLVKSLDIVNCARGEIELLRLRMREVPMPMRHDGEDVER